MVGHDAVSAQTHIKTLNALCKNILKGNKVEVLFEYPEFAVSTVKDMIRKTSFSYPLLCHGDII